MALETAQGLLSLATSLLDPIKSYGQWKRDRKDRVADFCEKISDCLAAVVEGAVGDGRISARCGELSVYMDQLMQALEGVVDTARVRDFSAILNNATINRTLVMELSDPLQRAEAIAVIEDAAGRFRGLSNVLRL
ncbi:MAG: hypothetical protein V4673_03490 [Pseudomonadota bacterium]